MAVRFADEQIVLADGQNLLADGTAILILAIAPILRKSPLCFGSSSDLRFGQLSQRFDRVCRTDLRGLGGQAAREELAIFDAGDIGLTDGGASWNAAPSVLEVCAFDFGRSRIDYSMVFIVGWVHNEYGIWQY